MKISPCYAAPACTVLPPARKRSPSWEPARRPLPGHRQRTPEPGCPGGPRKHPGRRAGRLHRAAVEADLLIATGIVEPHQYAGYSGGSKTVAVGAAGEVLIAHTHGPAFVDHPGTRLGRIEGNPFREAVNEAARRADLRFIINVVLDDDKRILRLAAGDPEKAFEELVIFARSIYEVPFPHQVDIAIGGVGFPKDCNLYQASRADPISSSPPLLLSAPGIHHHPGPLRRGCGGGCGEQRYLSAMRDAPNMRIHPGGCPPGWLPAR